MSVLIKGMEMPKEGTVIAIYTLNGKFYASAPGTGLCPLVPVPPHGRLIDADALHSVLRLRGKEFSDSEYGEVVKCGLADAREFIKNAPTVIPASGGTDNE